MSLQIWLPLNGDLHNQGLGIISNITGTPNYKNNGKINGNALDLKSRISIVCPQIANLQTFSICFWALAQSSEALTSTWVDLIGFSDVSSSGTNGTFRWETCYNGSNKGIHWHDNATNAFTNGSHYHITTHDIWTHCCVVFDNITKKIYSYDNGILTATHTHLGGSFNSTGTFYLGHNNVIEGMIQDVRIYDHALSAKEVEEISKGLVLHYKLDGTSCSNQNLLTPNLKACAPTAYNSYQLNLIEKLELNQSYTIQLWDVDVSHTGKTENQLGLGIYLGGWYNSLCRWFGPENFIDGHADYLSMTFTETSWTRPADAENLWLNIYNSPGNATGTRYMHIGAWKLEKGEVPTGWDGGENICYDSSGYGNDGDIVGSLLAVTDTSKYNCATYFDGSSIIAIGTKLYNMRDEMTVSIWANKTWDTKTGTPFSSVQGGGFGWQTNGTNYTFYCGTGSTSNTYISGTITINNLSDGWHMLSATYNGLALKLYIDGVLNNTINKYSTKTLLFYNQNSGMFVGGESNGAINTTSSDRFIGDLSDLRIYATALSDDQIKELYDTSVTIDNLGNIHAREFDENSNLNITKAGLFQANEIKDGNYQIASILKNTNSIQGNNLYEY